MSNYKNFKVFLQFGNKTSDLDKHYSLLISIAFRFEFQKCRRNKYIFFLVQQFKILGSQK